MELRKAERKDRAAIRRLYKSAFPARERKPFFMLMQKKNQPGVLVLDDGGFCGFVSMTRVKDILYIGYLAIAPSMRGQNYGSRILGLLKEKYPEMRIMLEIERLDENAPNREQRKRRRIFYHRNGFVSSDLFVYVIHCEFEILTMNGKITFQEYEEALRADFGPVVYRFIKKPSRMEGYAEGTV